MFTRKALTSTIRNGSKWYNVDGYDQRFVSVTTHVSKKFKPFNGREVIADMKQRGTFNKKYKNMTVDEVLKQWSDNGQLAAAQGTAMHSLIEDRLSNRVSDPEVENTYSTELAMYDHFMQERCENWKCLGVEIPVYSESLLLAGTIDAVFLNTEGEHVLIDWKRSAKIDKQWGGSPCETLRRYKLQLSIYSDILYRHYDITIKQCVLAAFHPELDRYKTWAFDPRVDICGLSVVALDTYQDFIKEHNKYITGHEYTRGDTSLELLASRVDEDATLKDFVSIPELEIRLPLRQQIKLTAEVLKHHQLNEILASLYIDVNITDSHGQTALMDCATFGIVDAYDTLIKAGADINAANVYGMTALIMSVIMGHDQITQRLIADGACPKPTCKKGYTVYDYARSKGTEL